MVVEGKQPNKHQPVYGGIHGNPDTANHPHTCHIDKTQWKHTYRISSNKRPGAYLKFRLKGGALIGRRALNRGGRLLNFPFNEL